MPQQKLVNSVIQSSAEFIWESTNSPYCDTWHSHTSYAVIGQQVITMEENNGANTKEDDSKSINVEIPGENKTRYVSVELPSGQYQRLDDLKDQHGLTWRGLLMHTHRQLNSPNIESTDQYEQLNETRQWHGFTWKGMLLHAARDLEDS
jgi:hypothetical protein